MKAKRLLAVVVTPLATVGLIGSMTFSSAGVADEPVAPAGVSGSTASTVGTKPQCAWSLDGVSSSVPLVSADSAKYSGEALPISGVNSGIDASVSGLDCSWYEYKKGASITISTGASPKFSINDATDTTMDFDLTAENPITLDIEHSCGPDFTADPSAIIGGLTVTANPFSITKGATNTTSTCTYAMTIGATVPANKSPKNAGTNYALVGPSLTTTLTLED